MAEYIEREALMRKIKEIHCAECDSYHGVRCRACWVDDALNYIDSEPAADVAPVRHGHWEWLGPNELARGCMCGTCSACNVRSKYIVNTAICPNCGAKME